MVDLKWKALAFTSPPLQSYHCPHSGWLLPLLSHTTSPLVLQMSSMPSIIPLKLPLSVKIVNCPPHYLSWFKLRFPTIHIESAPYGHYVMDICRWMQVTKHAVRQCNTIHNTGISSIGFVKHVIDHSLYTLNTNSSNDILIVICSTDYFLCVYSIIYLFKYFLAGIKKTSLWTPRKVLNSHISIYA